MRTDIPDWEKYNVLVEFLVDSAMARCADSPRALPSLDLLEAAEQYALQKENRALALKYGDVNTALEGLADGTRFKDVTEQLGALGLLVDISARAMVADAQRKPRWRAYLERNKDRWTSKAEP